MTVQAGVVGWPIAHSLSPLIHTTWIAAAGLHAAYVAYGPETPDQFAALLDQGRAGRLRGLNVTAPYKEQAFAAADRVSDAARLVGSGRCHAGSTGAPHVGAPGRRQPCRADARGTVCTRRRRPVLVERVMRRWFVAAGRGRRSRVLRPSPCHRRAAARPRIRFVASPARSVGGRRRALATSMSFAGANSRITASARCGAARPVARWAGGQTA